MELKIDEIKREDIIIDKLKTCNYEYDAYSNYKYININKLDKNTKKLIIEVLTTHNHMPKNFLRFIYDSCLMSFSSLYDNKNTDVDEMIEHENVIEKAGIIIKIKESDKQDQQLVFFCQKTHSLYEQFFLDKGLEKKNTLSSKFDSKEFEIELESKSSLSNKSNEKDKSRISSENKSKEKSETSNEYNYENKIDKYIKGQIFECEVSNYLKNKMRAEGNKELPSIFYTLREIQEKEKKIKTFFFNEFDSVFLVENDIILDEIFVKMNCKYENEVCEDTKKIKPNEKIKISKNNIVFFEVKTNGKFKGIFLDLLKKIHNFRDIFDNVYNTKNYGTILIYLYDTEYISYYTQFNSFQEDIKNAFTNLGKIKGINLDIIKNYTILCIYTYDNVYLLNSSDINDKFEELKNQFNKQNNELEDTKNKLKGTNNELEDTKNKLNRTNNELEDTKNKLNETNNELDRRTNEFNDQINKLKNEIELLNKKIMQTNQGDVKKENKFLSGSENKEQNLENIEKKEEKENQKQNGEKENQKEEEEKKEEVKRKEEENKEKVISGINQKDVIQKLDEKDKK